MRTTVASCESISIAAAIRRPPLHSHQSVLCVSAISIFPTLLNARTKLYCCFSLPFRFAHFNGWKIIWRYHSTKRDGSYEQRKPFDHDQQCICNNRKEKVISFKWSCIRVLSIRHDSLLKLWCECCTHFEIAIERQRQPTGSVHFDNLTILVANCPPRFMQRQALTFFFVHRLHPLGTAQQKNCGLFHFSLFLTHSRFVYHSC